MPRFLWPLLTCVVLTMPAFAADKPLSVKVIVAAMFEIGEATGDAPGELQLWVERLELTNSLDFPLGEHRLYLNDDGVMVVLIGGGIANAAASVMALGLDPRFDLSKSYWLVAGIAGADPADMSLGSAAWAKHVVDGDMLREIDAREMPQDWPYGLFPLRSQAPTQSKDDIGPSWSDGSMAFALNSQLVDWAFSLTQHIELEDAKSIAPRRKQYVGLPNAQRAPFVIIGDTLSSNTYWHGEIMNRWANDWVKLFAGDEANFVTSNMEDSGTLTAIHRLGRSDRVDVDRVLVLRTASNYTTPPPGKTPAWSLTAPYAGQGLPAYESAFIVGNTVVQALVNGWTCYERQLPDADESCEL